MCLKFCQYVLHICQPRLSHPVGHHGHVDDLCCPKNPFADHQQQLLQSKADPNGGLFGTEKGDRDDFDPVNGSFLAPPRYQRKFSYYYS